MKEQINKGGPRFSENTHQQVHGGEGTVGGAELAEPQRDVDPTVVAEQNLPLRRLQLGGRLGRQRCDCGRAKARQKKIPCPLHLTDIVPSGAHLYLLSSNGIQSKVPLLYYGPIPKSRTTSSKTASFCYDYVVPQDEIKTIMIVEDEEPLRKALAARMVREGYEVMLASNGQECLDKLKTKTPSLVVLDLLMPVKGGMDTLYEIQAKEETRNLPVLILTNKSDFSSHVKAYKYGVVNYFVKSNTSLDDLVNRVKQLVT